MTIVTKLIMIVEMMLLIMKQIYMVTLVSRHQKR